MIEFLETGVGYIQSATAFIRDDILIKLAGFLPWSESLSLAIVFVAISVYLGNKLVKKFVTNPLDMVYLPYHIIIDILIYITLMYF